MNQNFIQVTKGRENKPKIRIERKDYILNFFT